VLIDDMLIDLENKSLMQCFADKEHIVVPNMVTIVECKAFVWCESLQTIVFPNSIKTIKPGPFKDCRSLHTIFVPQGQIEYFKTILTPKYYEMIKGNF
jgi:hypothetical protein